MKFLMYVLRRLLYAVLVILGVTFMVFLLFNVVGGDPAAILLGKYATPQAIASLNHELGLDRPWLVQYWDILKSAFTFDFGYAWSSKQNILSVLKEGAAISLSVTLPAFAMAHILLISASLLMTKWKGLSWDHLLVTACTIMYSVPSLVYILIFQGLFAYKLGLFPITGYEPGLQCIPYILLPTIIQVILQFCAQYRFYRSIMLDEIHQDYVRTARAKGLPEGVILFKHVLKNAMVPIITIIIQDLPSLIFASVVVESFFCIPGLGHVVLSAIHCSDFPTIKAVTVVSAVLSVLFNTIRDVLYTLVEPRIKL